MRYVEVLSHGTHERGFIWKSGFGWCNEIKRGHEGGTSSNMTGALIRWRDRDTQGGHVMTEAEAGVTQLQAEDHQGAPATTRAGERQGRTAQTWGQQRALPTDRGASKPSRALISDFRPHGRDRMCFCHLKPPCLWHFVTGIPGHQNTLIAGLEKPPISAFCRAPSLSIPDWHVLALDFCISSLCSTHFGLSSHSLPPWVLLADSCMFASSPKGVWSSVGAKTTDSILPPPSSQTPQVKWGLWETFREMYASFPWILGWRVFLFVCFLNISHFAHYYCQCFPQ